MSTDPATLTNGGCERCADEWKVALAYLSTHPDHETSDWATQRCSIVVGDLVEVRLGPESAMPGARALWLVGHRHPVPLNPQGRPGQQRAEHRVVITAGGCLIDLTRRQYDPSADVPTHYASLDEAGRHWCAATPADAADEQLIPLIDPEHANSYFAS